MAKLTIMGNAAVVTSSLKVSDIDKVAKYNPAGLILVEKDDAGKRKEIFRIAYNEKGGSLNQFGATFNSTNKDGFATLTVDLGSMAADRREAYAKDKFGYGLISLNALEAEFAAAATKVDADFGKMSESISVID